MFQPGRIVALLATLAFLVGLGCGAEDPPGPEGDPGAGGAGGTGAEGGTGGPGGSGGSGGTGAGGAGGSGGLPNRPEPKPTDPEGWTLDHDCDGLSDAEEFSTVFPGGGKTDPLKADTDGDGIPDGVELGRTESPDPACAPFFTGDADPSTTTDPTEPDTDGDGRLDGEEDANQNGRVDPGETDPNDPDTDGDGLPDGLEVETGTDPLERDTDGDGLPDAVEDRNKNGAVDPGETDPREPDSDGDGLLDGEEDLNWNGVVDPGETDPLVADNPTVDSDGDGLTDEQELALGTDPQDPDTDGDGISDGEEVAQGTNPLSKDTDCDGIDDLEELNLGTDPKNPDSDGDGLSDGLELGQGQSPDPACEGRFIPAPVDHNPTDPLNPDTDGDGIPDGDEDSNRNGRLDPGETDPNQADTDGDDLDDGDEIARGTDPLSEDTDCDGLSDGEEVNLGTDPLDPDTDGDGLLDGLELGRTQSPDADCAAAFTPDAHPASTTDPLEPDTDGDGLPDGVEDANHDGAMGPGETDPNVADAFPAPVLAACGPGNAAPFDLAALAEPDLLFATHADFSESETLMVGGKTVGQVAYAGGGAHPDPIAGFVLVRPSAGSATAEEAAVRAAIDGLSAPITQRFTTWDGFDAVRGTYDLDARGADLRERLNGIVQSLVPGATGLLPSGSAPGGPYKLQLEVVFRHPERAVIVGALLPEASYEADNLWRMDDLVNGSALAQFGDATRPACESYDGAPWPKVDFVWVIDNSGSMGDDQNALAAAATAMGEQLQSATIDWRIATLTTDYDTRGAGSRRISDFTDDISTFQANAQPGTNGSGTERGFQPVKCALRGGTTSECRSGTDTPSFLPAAENDPSKIRPDSTLVLVFFSDESEQSSGSVQSWVDLFSDWDPANPGREAFVAGITSCDNSIGGSGCGQGDARRTRYTDLISQMQGIHGDLRNLAGISDTIRAILTSVIGATSPYELDHPPISASLRVAIDPAHLVSPDGGLAACPADDVPRSRANGFDYDGASRRLTFYGNCRPADGAQGDALAVSYRYWLDRTDDPYPTVPCGGPCEDPLVCNPDTNQCECPWNCGGRSPGSGFACDMEACSWYCPEDCGGYKPGAGFVCDQASCAWTCDESCNGQPRPSQNHVCDTSSCEWTCPEDCGGLEAGEFCDRLACEPTCAPDCGGACGPNFSCDTESCGCVCEGPSSTPAPGFVFDEASCSLVCDPGGVVCEGDRVVDPDTCQCVCPLDCGDCDGICDQLSCTCIVIE